jgi:ATP-dependent helicase/nuclease subunit B
VLGRDATLIVTTAQRQAAVRAAWAEQQRMLGHSQWHTPRVFTFNQYCERELQQRWARDAQPDQLLPAGAEWAAMREARREAGGPAEARALLNAVHVLSDWRIPGTAAALGATPESGLLQESLALLAKLSEDHGRKPLRNWLQTLESPSRPAFAAGFHTLSAARQDTLRRIGAEIMELADDRGDFAVAMADNDAHELELIAAWCRRELEADPARRLLIVDANLRRRRRHYERLLSQTLSPSEWAGSEPRDASAVFSIEGGRPLAEFPVISHALLTLKLLAGRLRFVEVTHWVNLPFLDGQDLMLGAAIEAVLRTSQRLEYDAEELAALLERANGAAAASLAARLRQAIERLTGERRSPAEWAPRILEALRLLGWHGSRPLRSDEQQAVARWHALLDEYSALGTWLPRAGLADAVAALSDLAAERNFDAASLEAPVTLTDSHDDPLVRYDGIWVAGLDAAQWPAAPRPDPFIPLRLQTAASIPTASAAGQTRLARASLSAWRRCADSVVCSWARLEGDAHRSPSPLLSRVEPRLVYQAAPAVVPLVDAYRGVDLEMFEDVAGSPVDTRVTVAGGVAPLTLQAECGFHAYGEFRLAGKKLEIPAPGLDARQRGMVLHKALELVWGNLDGQQFNLTATDEQVRRPMIANAVQAAVVHVFRGYVPMELRPAVEREIHRVELLIKALFEAEVRRAAFVVDMMEARRRVRIAGGEFELRIDRIDYIEGGGYAILDYKSGEPRRLRWEDGTLRDPQLIAYLLAERGRNVQALANVSLTRGRAKFVGRSSRKGLLPDLTGMPGMNPNKVPAAQIEATWQAEVERWIGELHRIAAAYIAGEAPVQPGNDVCRLCHLTTLCRRLELAGAGIERGEAHD